MKREHRLRYIIKEGLLDTFYIWKDELRNVFKDASFSWCLSYIRCFIHLYIITR